MLASILNGRQKEFCIMRVSRYGEGNCNLAYPPRVLCGPLLCPTSSCAFQSSCGQFGTPSPASIKNTKHSQIQSCTNPESRARSVLRVRILNMARRCFGCKEASPITSPNTGEELPVHRQLGHQPTFTDGYATRVNTCSCSTG